jgi:hypothetical protein
MSGPESNFPEALSSEGGRSEGGRSEGDRSEGRSPGQLDAPLSEAAVSAPLSESPVSQLRHTRSFIRAFSATNYLLGKRGADLGEGLSALDPQSQELLAEVTEQLSHGVQANRARVLAAEVGRLMRSLSTQKLK